MSLIYTKEFNEVGAKIILKPDNEMARIVFSIMTYARDNENTYEGRYECRTS